jgi:hypothetical protein
MVVAVLAIERVQALAAFEGTSLGPPKNSSLPSPPWKLKLRTSLKSFLSSKP